MPLPVHRCRPEPAIVKTVGAPICQCEEANGQRGALSAKRKEVPLGCNLGEALTVRTGCRENAVHRSRL